MLFLAGLYEQHISIFFLRRFNLTKNPLKILGKEVVGDLAGISSRMYKKIPPSLTFLSNLTGATYSSIVNWLDGNVESNFASEIVNIFKSLLMQFEDISNLFLIEFIFMWPIINLLISAMCLSDCQNDKLAFKLWLYNLCLSLQSLSSRILYSISFGKRFRASLVPTYKMMYSCLCCKIGFILSCMSLTLVPEKLFILNLCFGNTKFGCKPETIESPLIHVVPLGYG